MFAPASMVVELLAIARSFTKYKLQNISEIQMKMNCWTKGKGTKFYIADT